MNTDFFINTNSSHLEAYFLKYRQGIIGQNHTIKTTIHDAIPLIYADWTASGRMYAPIEEQLQKELYPYVANTHTETNYTGSKMTFAYKKAKDLIKQHVSASPNDILIPCNSGMTGAINKLQRILGLKLHESFKEQLTIHTSQRPIVFVTHMEHHSNHTSWLETIADVVVVPPDKNGLVSLQCFENKIEEYKDRKYKIVAITACSNVTGIETPYLEIAELIHSYKGLCFIDFACSAPYVEINMHENDAKGRYLDAIYFSPHKYLGGPGSAGILIFNEKLYNNTIPDHAGGGTVKWTNPWGNHEYIQNIEEREDGGTPPFLQTIKAALCLKLKNEMGVENIQKRESELMHILWNALEKISQVHILAPKQKKRLGILSFYIDHLHYNVAVKILNDRFGIQVRGGCSCAGTYGHYLLDVSKDHSKQITDKINLGDHSSKPGWIRISIHPTQTNQEVRYIANAIQQLVIHHQLWAQAYHIDLKTGNIEHKFSPSKPEMIEKISALFEEKNT